MRIPMTGLVDQYASIKGDIDSAITRVVESGRFVLGPEVEAFEEEMAAYCGTKFAVGVASGTDALTLSLIACGLRPGDEAITTPFTFVATAASITHCGGRPVFVDIDPITYNIDPALIESKITPNTRAIIPVHLFGQAAEMDAIMQVAQRHNLVVIEDCAQALSAEYNGKKVGTFGGAGCLSFFPSKNLGAFGDGGMVITNNQRTAELLKMLRQHGAKTSYYHLLPGFNSRLDAIQAAILRVKIKHLDAWSNLRRQRAALYCRLLSGLRHVQTPYCAEHKKISANYFTIRLDTAVINRDHLRKYLSDNGIETLVYYPLSLHLQEMYKSLGYKPGDFPHSELAQEQLLSLPMFPEITERQVTEIACSVGEFLGGV